MVAESVADYGGDQEFYGAVVIELKDGKLRRDTRYYAEPYEVPEWRSQ